MNREKIQEKSRLRFVLLYGIVTSGPLVLDYYIVKFLITSFTIETTIVELLIVWFASMLLGIFFAFFCWNRFKKEWHDQ